MFCMVFFMCNMPCTAQYWIALRPAGGRAAAKQHKQQQQHTHTKKQITFSTCVKNALLISWSRTSQSNTLSVILSVVLLLSSRSPLQLSVSLFSLCNSHLHFSSSILSSWSCGWPQFPLHTKRNPKRVIDIQTILAHTHKVVLCSMGTALQCNAPATSSNSTLFFWVYYCLPENLSLNYELKGSCPVQIGRVEAEIGNLKEDSHTKKWYLGQLEKQRTGNGNGNLRKKKSRALASFPGRSQNVFAYSLRSKTGGGNGLGTRLAAFPASLVPRHS